MIQINVSLVPIFALGFDCSCYSHPIVFIFFASSICYFYLSACVFIIFLAKTLHSQEGNFVCYGHPYPFLHYHLANLSVGNLVPLIQYEGVL